MSLLDELGGEELNESPYLNVVYASPNPTDKGQGSRLLSFIELPLSPTEKQLEKLEEEDYALANDLKEDPDGSEASMIEEDEDHQDLGATINGEVVWIREKRHC